MNAPRIGLIGDTPAADVRRESLRRLGMEVVGAANAALLPEVDAAFVASSPAHRHADVVAAARRGVPVFAEWPPALALADVQALVAVAEEAGVPIGTSRPLRFVPGIAAAVPSRLLLVRRTVAAHTPLLTAALLADLADLCRFATGSAALTRIEAHAERDASRLPQALAFALRFQNGAYAQVALHGADAAELSVYARAGRDVHALEIEGDTSSDATTDAETQAFLHAALRERPAPITVLDALQTLRLVEKLWTRLR